MKNILGFLGIVLLPLLLPAQDRGTWQDYLSYSNAAKVADAGDKIFCVSDGGLFYVDLEGYSINKITSADGLSDVGIQTIAWSAEHKLLLVVYKNSNIDLVYENRVVNLGDIKRKLVPGDKTIYNILLKGSEAFLSCGFGIVSVNLAGEEIRGTYIIGDNGSQVKVFDMDTDGSALYAATEKGIMTAPADHPNLLDYRNWTRMETVPHASEKFSQLAMVNGKLVAVYTRDQYSGDEAFLYSGGRWERVLHEVGYFSDLQNAAGFLTAVAREEVFVFDQSLTRLRKVNGYTINNRQISPINPRAAVTGQGGSLWIADYTSGLIRHTGQTSEQHTPSGPMNNAVFSLTVSRDELWVSSGGRTDPWNNQFREPAFQRMKEGEWSYYTKKEFPGMAGFFDMVEVAVDPRDPGHFFAASWGGGVLEFKNDQLVNRYNNLNSPLQTALPDQPLEPYTRIGGMAFDENNTLWITNSQSSNGLHSLSSSGEWKSFSLPEVSGFQFTIGQLIITGNSDKWIVIPRGRDLYVVNKDGSQKKPLQVTSYFNNGEQEIYNRMNDVYAIAEDLDGEIWVGTSRGIAVFANPRRIWSESAMYAYQPSLDLNDGVYHPLLETETVTSIVVDGANRKWLGTRNSGIYLVSETGDREILHFSTANSPLLSDNITSMAMNRKSGELYIGTDKGLISYKGDAPQGTNDFAGVYAYPNPVRETFTGDITITGLMKDTDVHITDIAGNLVFKGTSLGSQLLWDGKNLNGNRVATGVYLIFCADAEGSKTHVTKLLFIR